MRSRSCSKRCLTCGLVLFSGALLSAAGCAATKGPTVDSYAGGLSMTTASAEAARAANVTRASIPQRHEIRFHVCPQSGSVTHTPVYFRSETERPPTDGGVDGLWGPDFIEWIPETAKFLISIALHPVDVLMTPPWTLMESDGKQIRRAAPGDRKKHGSG